MSGNTSKTEGNVGLKDDVREELPKKYKVILLNDHYTTMEFVVEILMQVFHRTVPEAEALMLQVHRMGSGVAGVYVKQIAETKRSVVHQRAKAAGFPLKCTIEPE